MIRRALEKFASIPAIWVFLGFGIGISIGVIIILT